MRTPRRPAGACRVSCSATRARTASGTQTKKHQRQLALSVITPPSSGPETVLTAITAPM